MHIVAVTVKVRPGPENIARWKDAVRKNHEATRQEPGNIRFDVLLRSDGETDPEKSVEYLLYEVYRSIEDYEAHQRTAHCLAFRDGVADLMAEPRTRIIYTSEWPEPWL